MAARNVDGIRSSGGVKMSKLAIKSYYITPSLTCVTLCFQFSKSGVFSVRMIKIWCGLLIYKVLKSVICR